MSSFKLHAPFEPTGDQPEAIRDLVEGFRSGNTRETLLGVTGSGKTFTMANVIQALGKPTLVLAHNKTLAAQLYGEFKEFFPENAVEYFVSYYDYYQPEAYIPQTDTYIEKDSDINDDIDKLRHSATAALCERSDVIVVSSVSCIYGLGDPIDYNSMTLSLRPGMTRDRDEVIKRLVELQYERNDMVLERGSFRVHGDVLDVVPIAEEKRAYRVEFFGDEVDRISLLDTLTGELLGTVEHMLIFPASHYAISREKMEAALVRIGEELDVRVKEFIAEDKLLEAQRIRERTNFDIEMLRETGFCSGIENYSRHLAGRPEGSMPYTLLDYFPKDFLLIVDESHMTIPQVRGMYNGDRSRKTTLVDYGFRLPSAKDNRPLNFTEFEGKLNQVMFVSATPGEYEAAHSTLTAEQIIRPTGLLDPLVEVRPIRGQIDDIVGLLREQAERGEKTLITTLTKKMAEDLTDYLKAAGIKVNYLHSDIDTLERLEIVHDLRTDVYDVLVGINLLREGLDIPEVSLICILDADKEGFLRSDVSLIQTIGRAARNVNGHVILYADEITGSMQRALDETNRRRSIQQAYNEAHGITPRSIVKEVRDVIAVTKPVAPKKDDAVEMAESLSPAELRKQIASKEKAMQRAAYELRFEDAAALRDEIIYLRQMLARD